LEDEHVLLRADAERSKIGDNDCNIRSRKNSHDVAWTEIPAMYLSQGDVERGTKPIRDDDRVIRKERDVEL
jgi:hypothetical protein